MGVTGKTCIGFCYKQVSDCLLKCPFNKLVGKQLNATSEKIDVLDALDSTESVQDGELVLAV